MIGGKGMVQGTVDSRDVSPFINQLQNFKTNQLMC